MIKPEEVHLLVESIKQHSGTEVPAESALAALYELEQYRYRARESHLQQPGAYPPARTARSPNRIDVAFCQRCNRPMRIVQIQPVGASEFRTFECLNCKRQQAQVFKRA